MSNKRKNIWKKADNRMTDKSISIPVLNKICWPGWYVTMCKNWHAANTGKILDANTYHYKTSEWSFACFMLI
jgi:hypothetical protein